MAKHSGKKVSATKKSGDIRSVGISIMTLKTVSSYRDGGVSSKR
jgi:hypothetical protein